MRRFHADQAIRLRGVRGTLDVDAFRFAEHGGVLDESGGGIA